MVDNTGSAGAVLSRDPWQVLGRLFTSHLPNDWPDGTEPTRPSRKLKIGDERRWWEPEDEPWVRVRTHHRFLIGLGT